MSTMASTLQATLHEEPVWNPGALYRMTVEQYEAMVASGVLSRRDRVQLINGFLVEKMTQNPPHTIADILCGGARSRHPAGLARAPGQAGPAPWAGHHERA